MKFLLLIFLGMALSLEFLEKDTHKIIYEFSFTCGNSYLANKKIVADINNELKKNNVQYIYELVPKKNFSGIFNIYERIGDNDILLATNDRSSKLYQPILGSYPNIFINSFESPKSATEEEVNKRKQLVEQLLMNLNKN